MPQSSPITVRTNTSIPDNTSRLRDARLNTPPPSLNENVFTVPLEHTADEFVALAKSSLKAGREAAERARTIAQSILADRTRTELGAQRDTSDAVHNATKGAMEKIQKTIERLDVKTKALGDFLRGPPAPKDAVKMLSAMEARTALSQLPMADRRKLILAGIEQGDESVFCVLRCAPYLAGISPEEQEEYRARWAAKYHAPVVSQLKMLTTALDAVERGGRLLLDYGLSLTNAHEVEQARLLSARAAAAIAAGAE